MGNEKVIKGRKKTSSSRKSKARKEGEKRVSNAEFRRESKNKTPTEKSNR
jgi:hypothetical protein